MSFNFKKIVIGLAISSVMPLCFVSNVIGMEENNNELKQYLINQIQTSMSVVCNWSDDFLRNRNMYNSNTHMIKTHLSNVCNSLLCMTKKFPGCNELKTLKAKLEVDFKNLVNALNNYTGQDILALKYGNGSDTDLYRK